MTFEYQKSCFSFYPDKSKPGACPPCFNLLENPSFEAGLFAWTASDNVVTGNDLPFEGNQVALMEAGIASLFQDVPLTGTCGKPLFFSFNAVGENPPNLTVDILWLDSQRNTIGYGLKMIIPRDTVNDLGNTRVTFFAITDVPPLDASFARVLFSKGDVPAEGTLSIDQVILAPINGINLVQNHSFEIGLGGWTGVPFQPNFEATLQGFGDVVTTTGGSLFQDVSLAGQPANSSFLFSFGAFAEGNAQLTATILWLDQGNNTIGPPALTINIQVETLPAQVNYLTYLDLTSPSPPGAVTARIIFDALLEEDSSLRIDQVLFARAGTPNLVNDPSFEEGIGDWGFILGNAVEDGFAYEGEFVGSLGGSGDAVFQDVPLEKAAGKCFLFNYGFKVLGAPVGTTTGATEARVIWLNDQGQEIGLGLSLLSTGEANPGGVGAEWLVYTGITEPAPPGTAFARIQFTKPRGFGEESVVHLDKVVFGRLV